MEHHVHRHHHVILHRSHRCPATTVTLRRCLTSHPPHGLTVAVLFTLPRFRLPRAPTSSSFFLVRCHRRHHGTLVVVPSGRSRATDASPLPPPSPLSDLSLHRSLSSSSPAKTTVIILAPDIVVFLPVTGDIAVPSAVVSSGGVHHRLPLSPLPLPPSSSSFFLSLKRRLPPSAAAINHYRRP